MDCQSTGRSREDPHLYALTTPHLSQYERFWQEKQVPCHYLHPSYPPHRLLHNRARLEAIDISISLPDSWWSHGIIYRNEEMEHARHHIHGLLLIPRFLRLPTSHVSGRPPEAEQIPPAANLLCITAGSLYSLVCNQSSNYRYAADRQM